MSVFGNITDLFKGAPAQPTGQEFNTRNPNAVLDDKGTWRGLSEEGAAAGDIGVGSDGVFYGKNQLNAANAPGLAESLGGIKGMAQGLGAFGQLANAYVGYKNYDLAKKQYDFENNLARANYANSATAYNTNLQNSADVGLALAGSSMTPEQKAAYQTQIAGNKVSTKL